MHRCWKSTPLLVLTHGGIWRIPRNRVLQARSSWSIPRMRGTLDSGISPLKAQNQPPGLGGRIAEDCSPRRDLVAGWDVHAVAGRVEAPMVIGAADLPIDALAERQIGAEMRAPRALDDCPAPSIPMRDDAASEMKGDA